jgi:hypothetical protein
MRAPPTWAIVLLAAGCGQAVAGVELDGGAATGPDAPLAPDAVAAADAAADADPDADAPPGTEGVTLRRCTGRPFVGNPPGDFEHFGSEIVALGSVQHAGLDVLAVGPGAVTARAKFQYGAIFKDLEDEDVRVYLDDCSDWRLEGVATTDSDGYVSHTFRPLPVGIYDVRYEVVGDASTVSAQLWIVPPGTRAAVFDIDGTLTTSDFEVVRDFFDELLDGDYVPKAYPSAVELTHAVRAVGYVPIYLTGRPYWLTRPTSKWLAELGFTSGPLFLAPSNGAALPTHDGVGAFKLGTLRGWQERGLLLDWAHGNATTDVYAYLGVGLAANVVWIIGKHAGLSGTVAVQGSWAARTAQVNELPPVEQPFEW